jgi:hypothetical protein
MRNVDARVWYSGMATQENNTDRGGNQNNKEKKRTLTMKSISTAD